MMNHRIIAVQLEYDGLYVKALRVRMEGTDGSVFECNLLAEGEGELLKLTLEYVEESALRYASDCFKCYGPNVCEETAATENIYSLKRDG
ncbi:hypothetical protein EAQG_02437 [Escherichia coli TA464]|uniref:hypothetical protein n=1 Tax=Escherichia coli TaxID=562 RepID=UPI000A186F06|nr:hypothetical protein [Escherichia coli]OSL41007.1 hypothetical protein EAQG_02437 [Escherichia coli TA464]